MNNIKNVKWRSFIIIEILKIEYISLCTVKFLFLGGCLKIDLQNL